MLVTRTSCRNTCELRLLYHFQERGAMDQILSLYETMTSFLDNTYLDKVEKYRGYHSSGISLSQNRRLLTRKTCLFSCCTNVGVGRCARATRSPRVCSTPTCSTRRPTPRGARRPRRSRSCRPPPPAPANVSTCCTGISIQYQETIPMRTKDTRPCNMIILCIKISRQIKILSSQCHIICKNKTEN